jgi:hypothetical protein
MCAMVCWTAVSRVDIGGQGRRGPVGDASSYFTRHVRTFGACWRLTVVVLPAGSVECLTDGFWRYLALVSGAVFLRYRRLTCN